MIRIELAVIGAVGCFTLSHFADESLREVGAIRSLFEIKNKFHLGVSTLYCFDRIPCL